MKLLIIVDPQRVDHYSFILEAPDFNFDLLWHERRQDDPMGDRHRSGRWNAVHYWRDFATPADLLEKVRPDRILFFEIIDQRQIALNSAARRLGISAFYVEHGAAGDSATSMKRWSEVSYARAKVPYLLRRLKAFPSVLSSKRFYYSELPKLIRDKSRGKYAFLPLRMLMHASPTKALAGCIFRQRVPAFAILYNECNAEQFRTYMGRGFTEELLPGLPFFDSYYQPAIQTGSHIMFIEHPYLEENLLGWTDLHHRQIADALHRFARERGRKVVVKLHPLSDINNWLRYGFDPKLVEVVQQGDQTHLLLSSALVLGFSSSLVTGLLCARKNVVLLGWHPKPHIFGNDFSKTGLCHLSLDWNDLDGEFDAWSAENKAASDDQKYAAYLKRYNFPFDGRATERVMAIIRHNPDAQNKVSPTKESI